MGMKLFARSMLALSVTLTSTASNANVYVFRHKSPVITSNVEEPDTGYGAGNDVTAFFAGAIGYQFTKVIPVATKDVVEWRRVSGSYQPGLSLDPSTGVITGLASGSTSPRTATLMGYDLDGKDIARARITFTFFDPVTAPTNFLAYGHTEKYLYSQIPAATEVARWEALTTLPDDLQTDAGFLKGTPTKPYDTSLAFVGYDYMGKQVAFSTGGLLVEDGPSVNKIEDQHRHPSDPFSVSASVKHSVGDVRYRLIGLYGKPGSLTFDENIGKLSGSIPTFNTSLKFQIEAIDQDGTKGMSNVFTLSTSAPDIDISAMADLFATVGSAYSLKMTADDLTGDVTWEIASGSLPEGMSLDPDTGTISGTPSREEAQEGIVLSVSTSDGGRADSRPFKFTVSPEDVSIAFDPINARVGESFASQPPELLSGVIPPYSFAPAAGSVVNPAIAVDYGSATVSGSVGEAGSHSVAFSFTNGNGRSFTFLQPIDIFNAPGLSYEDSYTVSRLTAVERIVPTVPANSIIGEPRYAVSSGSLPDGLSLIAETGEIAGTPTKVGTFVATIDLIDGSGARTTSNPIAIIVDDRADIAVSVRDITAERFVENYVVAATATSAFNGVSYSLISGTLPDGLELKPWGAIIGSTLAGEGTTSRLRIRATDGDGHFVDSEEFSLTVTQAGALKDPEQAAVIWPYGVPFEFELPRPENAYGKVVYELAAAQPTAARMFSALSASSSEPAVDNGKLSGRLDELGTYTYPMTITDESGRTSTIYFEVVIVPPMTASIAPSHAIPQNTQFSVAPAVTNGIAPVSFSISGTLPTGLNFDSESGTISGTPAIKDQTQDVAITATDAAGTSVQMTTTLKIVDRNPVSVEYDFSSPVYLNSDRDLPKKPTVRNAVGAVRYTLEGELPLGLTFNPANGYIDGTPRADGRYTGFKVTAVDSEGADYQGVSNFDIGVSRLGPLGLPTKTYITARSGEPFSKALNAQNATKPVTFRVVDGSSLPEGVSLGETSGAVTGSLGQIGKYSTLVQAVDDFGRSGNTTVAFNILGTLTVTASSATLNQFAQTTVSPAVSNQVGQAIFELVGTLPQGLTFDTSTGVISGIPTVKGTFGNLVIKVMDVTGTRAETSPFSLTVIDRLPLTMEASTSYQAYANLKYALTLKPQNVAGKATFVQTGTLPPGISFNAVEGRFAGTPTAIGTFSGITVSVTDEGGGNVAKTFSIVVSANNQPISLTVANFVTKVGYPIATAKPVWSNHVGDTRFWADETIGQYNLGIDPATGVISGQATELMDFSPNIHITDSTERVTSKPIRIQVIPDMIVSVPERVNLTVNSTMTAVAATRTNVVGTATWSYEGRLPAGVIFTPSTGRFTGTPTEMGTFAGIVKSVDSLGDEGFAPISFVVANNGLPPTIDISYNTAGYTYSSAATITPAYSNRKTGDVVALAPNSAPLPPGMTLEKNASNIWVLKKVAAAATDVGVYRGINIRVTDVDGLYSETGPKAIIYAPLPLLGYPAQSFSTRAGIQVSLAAPQPSAGRAIEDVRFAFSRDVTGGSLKINPQTGAISGTIAGSGFNTVTVTESYDGTTIRTFTYDVTFTANVLDPGIANAAALSGLPNNAVITPTPTHVMGAATYGYTGLPSGLTFDASTGVISGTPTAIGSYSVKGTITDEHGSASKTITLAVLDGTPRRYWRIQTSTVFYRVELKSLTFFDQNGLPVSRRVSDGSAVPFVSAIYQPSANNTAMNLFNGSGLGITISNGSGTKNHSGIIAGVDFGSNPASVLRMSFGNYCPTSGSELLAGPTSLEYSDDNVTWTRVIDPTSNQLCTTSERARVR